MKSSPAPLKYVIGSWIRPQTTSVYINKKKCKSDHGTWGRQKAYFQSYIIHSYGPTGFAVGEAKMILSPIMSSDHGKEMSF